MKRLLGLIVGLIFALPSMAANLPSGYTELQWIEKKQGATGYIDTNVPQGDNVGIKVNVKFSTYVSDYQYVAGAFAQGSYIGIWKDNADVIKFCHVNTIKNVSNTNTTDFQVIENNYLNSRKYRINGTDEGNIAETTSVTSPTIYIFNTHYGSMFKGGFLLAGAEITVGGEVVRNFVPVKHDSDNRLGMYDTVNDKFYAITNYENFVAGEPVNPCKNLFNKYDSDVGDGHIDAASGQIVGMGRSHTGYILVKPNTTYHVTLPEYQTGSANGIAYYTANKTFVSGVVSGQSYGREPYNFTVPNDDTIVYARLTLTNNIAQTDLDAIQIEEGDHGTSYVPYNTMCWCKNLAEPKFAGVQVTGWNGINIKSAGTYSVKLIRKDDWTPPANSYVGLGSVNPGLDPSRPNSWSIKGGWLISNGTISRTFVSAELPGTHQLLGVSGIDQTTFFQHFDVMLVSGSYTASSMPSYEPYNPACFGIKIATTAYNTAKFSSVVTALNNAVDTIKTVVANTITQATAIGNLQSGKQTMPDSTATNGTCPNYKQCLLVEDNNGAPHWYVITDPFRDFVTPIIATRTNGTSYTWQNGLPLGYTQLEYIESPRGAYIDTGITYGKFVHDIQFIIDGQRNLQGNGVSDSMFWEATDADRFKFSSASNGYILGNPANRNIVEFYMSSSEASLTIGNDTITHTHGNVNKTYLLFALNGSTTYSALAKLYSLKVYDLNDVLVRDFIPAKQGNTVGLFDAVNGVFYTNDGTGDLIDGPVVPRQIPTWFTTWTANANNGIAAGTIYGEALCNGVSGTWRTAATSAQMSNANWNVDGQYCWCNVNGVQTGNDDTPVSSDVWIFSYSPTVSYTTAQACNANCAKRCAQKVYDDPDFRQPVITLN